jgi:hypothetical protein
MVRITGFHPVDPGSSPGMGNGDVAQLVERSLSMREVKGSIPFISKCLSSSVGRAYGFSTVWSWVRAPRKAHFVLLAQLVERKTFNLVVMGSSPI